MMPSRGWQLARGSAPRAYQAQCRKLSSASRRIPQRSSPTALSTPRIPQWRLATPVPLASISSIRHASTTPAQTGATPTPPSSAPAEASSTSFPNLETTTLDDIDLSTTADVASIPEKIGYLHELGLNYGWGPTSMLEWTIEHIHIYADLPWCGAVALTAVGLRLLLLPLYIKSSDMIARQTALMSVTKPISDKMSAAQKSGDTAAVQAAWMEMMATRKRAGLSMWDQMAPMVIQGVFGFCGYKLIRAMAALPVPALKTDGFLWLQDMTLSDPYLILPLAMAGTIHLLVRMGGESGAAGINQMAPGMRTAMLWGMPALIFVTLGFQSGLLCVWFASGGALGVIQGQVLKNPTVRQKLNMAPLYTPNADEIDKGYMGAVMGNLYKNPASTTAAGPNAASVRKNATAWMNTSYQSPNLRRNANTNAAGAGRVIDVNPVNKTGQSATKAPPNTSPSSAADPDMIQPKADKSGGLFGPASEKFAAFRKKYERKEMSEEEMVKRRKQQFKQRAQAYEKRYQERKGR